MFKRLMITVLIIVSFMAFLMLISESYLTQKIVISVLAGIAYYFVFR